jgi:hypothetical protein
LVFRQEGLYAELVSDLQEKAFQLVPNGDSSNLADPLLVLPLSQLSEKKLRLVGSRMIAVTEALLALRLSDDLATVSKALQSLAYITTYKFNPVYIGLGTKTFSYSSDKSSVVLSLQVLDSLGRAGEVSTAEVVTIKPVGASAAGGASKDFFQGARFLPSSAGDGTLTLDLGTEELPPGKFTVQVALTVSGQAKVT